MSRRLTIRARLTLLTGAMVALLCVALLGTTYALLSDVIDTQPIRISPIVVEGGPDGEVLSRSEDAEVRNQVTLAEQQQRADFRTNTLAPLVQRVPVVLAAVVAAALLVGWFVSGRAVRPVGGIAASARRIASRNVHERIRWGEPRDELRELADTFDDILARLEEAIGDQWRFVANASHELKTPLAINRTLLEVAMARPGAPPALTQLGETLLEVNGRHEQLINGLLTLAHSEHAVSRPVHLDLADVVRRVAEAARPEAHDLGVEISVEASPAPLQGDPALLERMLLNLAQNAIRYNLPSGWVRLRCARVSGAAVVTVSNTGSVLQAHDVPALFEPFRRLQDRVGSARGTGLGLSIVRSVARAHGGEVVASPRPGGGLDVEVRLPAVLPTDLAAGQK